MIRLCSALFIAVMTFSGCSDNAKPQLGAATNLPEAKVIDEPATKGPDAIWHVDRWWYQHFQNTQGWDLEGYLIAQCYGDELIVQAIVPVYDPDLANQKVILELWDDIICAEEQLVRLQRNMEQRHQNVLRKVS